MKAFYATEREFLEDFAREQEARELVPLAGEGAIERKHLTSIDLETREVTSSMELNERATRPRPFALRRRGR